MTRNINYHSVQIDDDKKLTAETVGCGCCAETIGISVDELKMHIEVLQEALHEAYVTFNAYYV